MDMEFNIAANVMFLTSLLLYFLEHRLKVLKPRETPE